MAGAELLSAELRAVLVVTEIPPMCMLHRRLMAPGTCMDSGAVRRRGDLIVGVQCANLEMDEGGMISDQC